MRKQQGISYWSVVILIFVAFLGIQFVVAVGGTYIDDYTMNKSIKEHLKSAQTSVDPDTFLGTLNQEFQMDGLRAPGMMNRLTAQNDGSDLVVIKKYEVRQPFIGNIDLVVHFDKTFDQKTIQSGN